MSDLPWLTVHWLLEWQESSAVTVQLSSTHQVRPPPCPSCPPRRAFLYIYQPSYSTPLHSPCTSLTSSSPLRSPQSYPFSESLFFMPSLWPVLFLTLIPSSLLFPFLHPHQFVSCIHLFSLILCSLYLTGTTGPPKAVMISHDNITWTAKVMSHSERETGRGSRLNERRKER